MHTALLIIFTNTWIFPYSWELRLVPRYSYNLYPCFPLGCNPHISPLSRGVYPIYPCLPPLSFFLTYPFPQGLPTPEDASASGWRQVQRRNNSLKLVLPSMFYFQNNRKGYIKNKVNVIQGKRIQQKGKKKSRGKKVRKST